MNPEFKKVFRSAAVLATCLSLNACSEAGKPDTTFTGTYDPTPDQPLSGDEFESSFPGYSKPRFEQMQCAVRLIRVAGMPEGAVGPTPTPVTGYLVEGS